MNLWVIITFVLAGVVFGIDYLLRRKLWKNNTKEEKTSLLINMFSVGPYTLLSIFGFLRGIVSVSPETAAGEILYNVTLNMGAFYYIIAIAAVTLSFIFRKTGKIKASIWVNIIALLYITAVLAANYFIGNLL